MSVSAAGAAGESKAVEEAAAHAAAEAEAKAKAEILTILHKRRFPDCENWIAEEDVADIVKFSDAQWKELLIVRGLDAVAATGLGIKISNDVKELFGKPACLTHFAHCFPLLCQPSRRQTKAKVCAFAPLLSVCAPLLLLRVLPFFVGFVSREFCRCTLANEKPLEHTLAARSRMQQTTESRAHPCVCFCRQREQVSEAAGRCSR